MGRVDVLDDRREEQCKAVDWTKASHANEHKDVYLPVFDGLPNIFFVEVIGQMAVIFSQTAFNLLSLFSRQEGGTVFVSSVDASLENEERIRSRIVIDAPKCYRADKDAEETLKND